MAEKKKQHFVSQFLLKNFSSENNSVLINLYNRNIDKLVLNATIRTQAQKKYFYGIDPSIEDYLSNNESKASLIFKQLIEGGLLPDYKNKDYGCLLHFIMLNAFRTKKSVNNTEERVNLLMKEFAQYFPELQKIDFEKYRIVHPEPAAFNIASYIDNCVITYDLNSAIITNTTESDFIVSDNPFITYNPLMLKRGFYDLASGLANKGLIILFPISTKKYLILYDSWAYETNEVNQNIEVTNTEDIYNINLLQSISCDEIIYFSNSIDSEEVKKLANLGFEKKDDSFINDIIDHPQIKGKKLLCSFYLEHKISLELSFIKEKEFLMNCNDLNLLSGARNKEIEDWLNMDKKKLRKQNLDK
jgi:hypothetical protein